MDIKMYILAFLLVAAFFLLCLLALRRFVGSLARFMFNFWANTGVIGVKDAGMDNSRTNGFVLVGSVLFLLLGGFGMIALDGLRYFLLKMLALVIVIALFAPLIAKRLGRSKRK